MPADSQSVEQAATDLPAMPADSHSTDAAAIDLFVTPADSHPADSAATDLPRTSGPSLTMTPPTLDFGILLLGRISAPQTFKVTNVGGTASGAVTVVKKDNTFSDGGASLFSYTTTCQAPLAPADSCDIVVTFNPTVGVRDSAILIASDGTVSSEERSVVGIALPFSDPVNPCRPSGFADTLVGQTSAAVVCTISNTSTLDVEAITVTTTGDFVISQNGCNTPLAPGVACTFSLVFKPTATGQRTGTVTVTSSSGDVINQPLSGKGLGGA